MRAFIGSSAALFALTACAGSGEVKVNAATDDENASAFSASAGGDRTEGTKTLAISGSSAAPPAPVDSAQGTPVAPAPACPLQCYVAQKGRVAPADEQRLATELGDALASLRGCGSGNSLTIRFDSAGQLTEFGVDAERGQEGACVQAVRDKRPAVSYPGPSTLRCSEKCAGATPTRARRRR